MPVLLHLDSSADLTTSVSRGLTARFAEEWQALSSEHVVVRRDLHTAPLPHLPTNALHWAPHLRNPADVVAPEAEALQQELLAEVIGADVVVVGAPMYNWSMPSTLKAWIDYIQVAGVTSPFDKSTQPLAGKPIVVISSRGDTYAAGSRNAGADHEIPALKQVFGVALGMQVHVVKAELTLAPSIPAMEPLLPQSEASLKAAQEAISSLVQTLG